MWVAVAVNLLLTALVVCIHYECLRLMSDWMGRRAFHRRIHLLASVFGALAAHVIEIWIYGLGIYLLLFDPSFGSLAGDVDGSLLDSVYFSLSNYTSLGMGDIQPLGPVRFVAGFEALTGLVLITWTASFLFIEMQRTWRNG